MPHIPREKSLDSTLALFSEGYRFISSRCERYDTDVFETRLMLRKVYCMMGEEAAAIFYEAGRFTRKGALPPNTVRLLQDKGSVQLMDGEAHRRRKRMFMSLMTPAAIEALADRMVQQWRERLDEWERADEIVLHDEVQDMLCRAACGWAGVPLPSGEAERRTREFRAMIEGAGTVGPRNWWGMLLRARSERWARGVIERVRTGELKAPEGSAAQTIALHRDGDGELLDAEVAAVELINVLRPTVAVARFATFAALALHEHPEAREKARAGGEDGVQWFVQEVRRFYPFFPAVGGRAREPFEWRGHRFAEGTWMLLDLYGTNRDPRTWDDPDAFRPDRFRGWSGSPFGFVPQGGGDHRQGHRCAGEWITVELVKRAVRLLTTEIRYDVPEQDLGIDLSRMPAIPKSRFVMANVRRA